MSLAIVKAIGGFSRGPSVYLENFGSSGGAFGIAPSVSIQSDGFTYHSTIANPSLPVFEWKKSGLAASTFEFMADQATANIVGSTGSWLSLGTSRFYSRNNTNGVPGVDTMRWRIRRASDGVVLATCTVTLTWNG